MGQNILERILEGSMKPTNLSLETLQKITDGFSTDRIIGQGGFATVYKGDVGSVNVAVKRIKSSMTINDKLFRREVDNLMEVNHQNVVRFLGMCSNTVETPMKIPESRGYIYAEIRERLLCFEYINNGSLDTRITDELRGLEWDTRYQIIKGICAGLHYLHMEKHILHMDLKPANILLDNLMVPKITDFGLSRPMENSQTMTKNHFASRGYSAPENIFGCGKMSVKSDMYSLGVIIIEMVTGHSGTVDSNNTLRRWRHRWKKAGKEIPLEYHQQVTECIKIGSLCQKENPYARPFISDIMSKFVEMENLNNHNTNANESTVGQKNLPTWEDDMLGVEPLELQFGYNKQEEVLSCLVELSNDTDGSIFFEIQKMRPLPYSIKPNKEIVKPRSKFSVDITLPVANMHALQYSTSSKRYTMEFIVRSIKVNRGLTTEDINEDMFDEHTTGHNVDEIHLAVISNEPCNNELMLNQTVRVKGDGTVAVDVPSPLEKSLVDNGGEDACDDVAVEKSLDGAVIPYRPPIENWPPIHIVMLIVGTREDVQPFVAIGKRLQDYGHRVRLATHANYKELVLTAGLKFFPLGGDPEKFAEYMVKNKRFLPSGPSETPIQRKQMKEIIFSLLPACEDPDPDTGIPFKVDAVIANPPAYGHTHVAEALRVPIHIFCTMPWIPTSEPPHPLSGVKHSAGYRLFSPIVNSMSWLGKRDMISEFREKKLNLRPARHQISGAYGSGSAIPHAYIWSPCLVPVPKDWGPKNDAVGFCFLDLASNYVPSEALVKWLEAGDRPIYVGFGSLPVESPAKMTETIVQALIVTGQRGIINKGWGGLGTLAEPNDFVYVLDNCPHDWLFLQCKAVVHHGGAGTTAAGLKAECPTTIVPFFSDQQLWGDLVHARGIGPLPIPVHEFNLPKLVDAIKFMLDPEVKKRAVEIAKAIEVEDGVTGAVKAFFKHLPKKYSLLPWA